MAKKSIYEGILRGLEAYREGRQAKTNERAKALESLLQAREIGSYNQSLPAGLIRVGTKVMTDPSYLNPLEQSRMELNRQQAGGGIFGVNPLNPYTGDAMPPQLTPKEQFEKLDPQNKALVQGVLDYQIDPTKTSSMRQGQREKLVKFASAIDPTYDQTQFPTRSAYRKEFSSGKIGANIRSFNTAIQHLAELHQAAGEVPSNPIRPIEAGQRAFVKNFQGSSPTATAMSKEDAAISAVSGELANIFKNSGGTDQEIDKWFKAYNPNSTKEAKRQFIKTGIDLMNARIGTIGSDYERVMGKKNQTPLIYPQSQAAINKIQGAQTGRKSGGVLHVDAQGNKAIVYPDGSYEEIP